MSFVILRAGKIKTIGGVIAAARHNLRARETPNANPEKTPLNVVIEGDQDMSVVNGLKIRLEKVDRKIKKDAVLAVEYMITASPDFFERYPKMGEKYLQDSLRWIEEKHGAKNIIQATIHMDESTPHLHAIVVPVRKKEKKYTHKITKETTTRIVESLDAKYWLDGKKKLREMQTEFAKNIGLPYGLKRGIEGSQATHEQIAAWYGRKIAENGGEKGNIKSIEPDTPKPGKPTLTKMEVQVINEMLDSAVADATYQRINPGEIPTDPWERLILHTRLNNRMGGSPDEPPSEDQLRVAYKGVKLYAKAMEPAEDLTPKYQNERGREPPKSKGYERE